MSRYGYRGDPALDKDKSTARADGGGGYSVPEYAKVVYGGGEGTYNGKQLPRGGCESEAYRKLGGTLVGYDANPPIQLRINAEKQMDSDSRVTSAVKRWSACMSSAGYDYSSPQQAKSDPRWGNERALPGQVSVVSKKQIATAMTDNKCRTSTNLVGVKLAVLRAYERRAIERNVEPLRKASQLMDERLKAAAQALQ